MTIELTVQLRGIKSIHAGVRGVEVVTTDGQVLLLQQGGYCLLEAERLPRPAKAVPKPKPKLVPARPSPAKASPSPAVAPGRPSATKPAPAAPKAKETPTKGQNGAAAHANAQA